MKAKSTPSRDQRLFQRNQARRAVGRICDAWPLAVEAAAARGYPTSSGLDGTRGGSDEDPILAAALRNDRAGKWLVDARRLLVTFVVIRGRKLKGVGSAFVPADHRETILTCLDELVEIWPPWFDRALTKLLGLSGTAGREWPRTPHRGQVIDGITVNAKTDTVQTCTECHGPIAGGNADPLARIDGEPYHRTPCYSTASMRKLRSQRAKKGKR